MPIIMGIDPGTATTGYGLIRRDGNRLEALSWGLIETNKNLPLGERFIDIFSSISSLIRRYKPNAVAIEKVFFASNAKTAITIGQSQGVMLYCFARNKIDVYEYSPAHIKKTVTGMGRATKKDIQRSLRSFFGSKIRSPKNGKTHFDNAADALAVALCHAISLDGRQKEVSK